MSDVYTTFKPIRNKIRKYTPISIIGMANPVQILLIALP
jgi:hypothetical protein